VCGIQFGLGDSMYRIFTAKASRVAGREEGDFNDAQCSIYLPQRLCKHFMSVTNFVTLSRQRKLDVNENEKVSLRHLTTCIPTHTFFKNI
jgi:hypothetical protein